MRLRPFCPSFVLLAPFLASMPMTAMAQFAFVDSTEAAGLGHITASRLCFADVNSDDRADVIVRAIDPGKPDRFRVFLNAAPSVDAGGPPAGASVQFREVAGPTGLPTPLAGDCLVFADLDNDGHADAIFTRYLDVNNSKFAEPPAPARTSWLKGRGDGTFEAPQAITGAKAATTACIAVGDANLDGTLDLFLGNWYQRYGENNEAFTNDLLLASRDPLGPPPEPAPANASPSMQRPRRFDRASLPEDSSTFTEAEDNAGRPTYGALFLNPLGLLEPAQSPKARVDSLGILELNYGRRANRLFIASAEPGPPHAAATSGEHRQWSATDLAPQLGLDGDADRSGKYPVWLKERAKSDPRFDREDEKPFRSHGNTFDATIGDIDNDGDFDLFVAEITHGWAGPSSDRSRFLINQLIGSSGSSRAGLVSNDRLSVDRIPPDPAIRNWNQGDLFAELADFDHDGRLDLLLSSGDYPDNQRLRVFHQREDGTLADITAWSGLNNEGSQQISIGDVDTDGDLDILVGQSFNRLEAAQIAGRTPTLKLYVNQTVERRRERLRQGLLEGVESNSIVLRLKGNLHSSVREADSAPTPSAEHPAESSPGMVNRDALGAVIIASVDLDADPSTPPATILRQLIGIGGHAGKQNEFLVHIPLGKASKADRIEVVWPTADAAATNRSVLTDVSPGQHMLQHGH